MSLNDRKQNSRHNSYFEAYPLMKLFPVALHWLKAKRSAGLAASSQALVSVFIMGVLLLAGAPTRADTVTYIHSDFSGSPLAATDESGNLLWRESYYAYGQKTQWQPAADEQSQWFHGKEQDADTGMQYFGARYYDPSIGRFLGMDPVDYQDGNIHSFNRYAYGNNNPGKYKDPDGRNPLLIVPLVWMGGGAMVEGTTNAVAQWLLNRNVQWTGLGGVFDAASEGAILGPVLGAISARTGAVSKTAEAAADAARAAGRTKGAASELRIGDRVFTDVSTGGASRTLHPDVNAALDKVPKNKRAPWHGYCAEMGCLSQSLDAGVNPEGGTSRAVNIGSSGRGHGTPKQTCPSCRNVLDQFGVNHD
ncbi:RHS repeat-associated core domain-containing protein [Comamonas sp. MYb396]|uniref:RHS repeat-associated core domain-containing protein n=1 Tax=Comamonas sp. MYb396 TaxID=2745302 RepID=UPI0030ACFB8E